MMIHYSVGSVFFFSSVGKRLVTERLRLNTVATTL